jgi:hypothetical protein
MKDIIKQIERKIDELKTLAHLADIEIHACTGDPYYDCELGIVLRAYMASCLSELKVFVDY